MESGNTTSTYYRETLPPAVASLLERESIPEASIRLAVRSDLDLGGDYSDQWVIVTDTDAILANPRSSTLECIPLKKLRDMKVENQVTTGILTARVARTETILARFSNTWIRKFSSFVKLVEKVKTGEALSDSDLAGDQEAMICPQCGRR